MSSNKLQTRKTSFLVYNKLAQKCVDLWMFDDSEMPNTLPRDLKAEYFARKTEKCKILNTFLDNDVKTFDDHGCPKNRDLFDKEM